VLRGPPGGREGGPGPRRGVPGLRGRPDHSVRRPVPGGAPAAGEGDLAADDARPDPLLGAGPHGPPGLPGPTPEGLAGSPRKEGVAVSEREQIWVRFAEAAVRGASSLPRLSCEPIVDVSAWVADRMLAEF